ncbi:MAG: hypothetical protein CMH28_03435 [Micavibrio sp.]|nr:hypothetical protein [Micavibrio sp.]
MFNLHLTEDRYSVKVRKFFQKFLDGFKPDTYLKVCLYTVILFLLIALIEVTTLKKPSKNDQISLVEKYYNKNVYKYFEDMNKGRVKSCGKYWIIEGFALDVDDLWISKRTGKLVCRYGGWPHEGQSSKCFEETKECKNKR